MRHRAQPVNISREHSARSPPQKLTLVSASGMSIIHTTKNGERIWGKAHQVSRERPANGLAVRGWMCARRGLRRLIARPPDPQIAMKRRVTYGTGQSLRCPRTWSHPEAEDEKLRT